MFTPTLTLITQAADVPEPVLLARLSAFRALPPEARARVAVQLRDPELSGKELHALGRRLRDATAALGASFVVNDRLDLALLLGADGVHLGRRSVGVADARALLGAGVFVSVACHSVDEVLGAAEAGADAAVLSPIFATPGKGPPLGLSTLREARARLAAASRGVAILALGGVDAASAPGCLAAGADGVAAIRADFGGALPAPPAG
ncbi:thiamine-phosphate diphosphorylase [Sorangium cellulosum]|uniref:Thiamine-phosphate diphosphorylase n=1 Tax=Sorangium cellulosum TaxID=56 RepID=A0A2L0EWU0_SORCE|nr:thiamine phosphate synthase [Sorangium cellulosum]AUX43774.1 thiamine-phosphate diphosphorylase [Sorangium cellulosum]